MHGTYLGIQMTAASMTRPATSGIQYEELVYDHVGTVKGHKLPVAAFNSVGFFTYARIDEMSPGPVMSIPIHICL
jgi:hypothetical protein